MNLSRKLFSVEKPFSLSLSFPPSESVSVSLSLALWLSLPVLSRSPPFLLFNLSWAQSTVLAWIPTQPAADGADWCGSGLRDVP